MAKALIIADKGVVLPPPLLFCAIVAEDCAQCQNVMTLNVTVNFIEFPVGNPNPICLPGSLSFNFQACKGSVPSNFPCSWGDVCSGPYSYPCVSDPNCYLGVTVGSVGGCFVFRTASLTPPGPDDEGPRGIASCFEDPFQLPPDRFTFLQGLRVTRYFSDGGFDGPAGNLFPGGQIPFQSVPPQCPDSILNVPFSGTDPLGQSWTLVST